MFKFKKLIITLAIILTFSASVLAQENTNILPLHTGKSYVLDFPVKVTRVVGGDPSAMELNLFKKDENNPDSNGYQLLVAPISERTTNIIVWTEAGLYVFDVIIDNSSPFTADTIINVPDAKKFTIPLVNTTGSNIPIVKTQSKPTQDVQVLDEGVNNENETFNAAAPVYTDPDIATSEDIKNHEEYSHIENNSQEYISSNNETQNANSNEKLPELKAPDIAKPAINKTTNKEQLFELDKPPKPEITVKENKSKAPDKNLNESKKKKVDKIAKAQKSNPVEEKTKPVEQKNKVQEPKLKPQIKINPAPVEKSEPEKQNPEVIEISLKPQTTNEFDIHSSIDSKASKLYNGQLKSDNNGLNLEISSVNVVNNSLVIHLSLKNITSDCKYLLWDLTKVTDDNGTSLLVRNQNLPPGIIAPGKTVKGDIVAYPKKDNQSLPTSGNLHFALLGLQGELLFKTEIPLQNYK